MLAAVKRAASLASQGQLGRQLAAFASWSGVSAVPRIGVGTKDFETWRQGAMDPAILTGGLASYDLSQHSLEGLQSAHADQRVSVEVSAGGADYRDAFEPRSGVGRAFQQDVEVPLSHLLDHIRERDSSDELGGGPNARATLLYLAQKDIRDVFPNLALDPALLPIQEAGDRLFQQSIWLGPRGTTTPLHCDPYYNLLCQVWGRKRVRIYDAADRQRLFPYPQGVLRNTSQVSCDASDPERFPGFEEVGYMECVVEPGEILFMPKKYWHQVVALTGSLSLSFWWT